MAGLCPLPFENAEKNFGPGIRTWQFASSLAGEGHRVRLVAMRIPGAYSEREPGADRESFAGVDIERVDGGDFFDPDRMRDLLGSLQPDGVVGATVYGSRALAHAEPACPFWADQFGHYMAEAQAKAYLENADWPVRRFWEQLAPVLQTADRFSTVSQPQRWAQIGELGLVGRLTAATCGYDFTAVCPCGLIPELDPTTESPRAMRGRLVPDDSFVVLWSGGYNVWSDVSTIFSALEEAMSRDPRICFVSTGGEIGGHDESTYEEFRRSVAGSRYSSRFHLLGWVSMREALAIQREADLGVLAERPIYEGALGSKNRIIQWLGGGLLAAYNRYGELGTCLARERIGLTFELGDAEDLARCILWASKNPSEAEEIRQRARAYAAEHFTFEATTRELREWAADPRLAPDRRRRPTEDVGGLLDESPTLGSRNDWSLRAPGFTGV